MCTSIALPTTGCTSKNKNTLDQASSAMDPAVYQQINLEIEEVINGMTPVERIYHMNKIGLKFIELLDDYFWDTTFTTLSSAEVQVVLKAPPTRQNIEDKIAMWVNSWAGFSFSVNSASEKACLAEETGQMITMVATVLPDHPVTGRLQRWTMEIYNRQQRTFNYDMLI